ncbi:MAG: prolipoprotein diacylglyceryl transferase [Solirubrobacteraceae bacterium]
MSVLASIPSPAENGLHIGPLFFHAYGIAYVFAVGAAIAISRWGWRRRGGDPDLVYEVAMWGFPAGLAGGRIYFDITTPSQVPDHWWGVFAIWQGGLGIWGGIAGGAAGGLWILHRRLSRADIRRFMDVAAPGLLAAQAIGRIGNYFNQELFGKPTSLPWGLQISPEHRPSGYLRFSTFQPTFLYEMIWNLSLAGVLLWLAQTRRVRAPGCFALYVAGYSAFRMFEESLRIDYSNHILGLRLNFFVALALCLLGLAWFAAIQRGWRGFGGTSGNEPVAPASVSRGRSTAAGEPQAGPAARPSGSTPSRPAGPAPGAEPRLRPRPSGRGTRPPKRS